jgi:hypothetical protein
VGELTPGCFKSSSDFAEVLKRDGRLAGAAFRSLDGCFRNVRTLGELECAPAEAGTGFPDCTPVCITWPPTEWRGAAELSTIPLFA